jgi:hypothetical protein
MEKSICVLKQTCIKCGKIYKFPVFVEDLEKYTKRQEGIQYALPYISPEYRELMLSGICPDCWEEIMKTEEE